MRAALQKECTCINPPCVCVVSCKMLYRKCASFRVRIFYFKETHTQDSIAVSQQAAAYLTFLPSVVRGVENVNSCQKKRNNLKKHQLLWSTFYEESNLKRCLAAGFGQARALTVPPPLLSCFFKHDTLPLIWRRGGGKRSSVTSPASPRIYFLFLEGRFVILSPSLMAHSNFLSYRTTHCSKITS